MWGNFFYKIALVVMLLLGSSVIFGIGFVTVDGARTYVDTIEFDNLQEARVYQNKIEDTALEYDGKIIINNLTITSPPKLAYKIVLPGSDWMPEEKYFPYGKRDGSTTMSWMMLAFCSFIALLPFIGAIYFLIKPLSYFRDRK